MSTTNYNDLLNFLVNDTQVPMTAVSTNVFETTYLPDVYTTDDFSYSVPLSSVKIYVNGQYIDTAQFSGDADTPYDIVVTGGKTKVTFNPTVLGFTVGVDEAVVLVGKVKA